MFCCLNKCSFLIKSLEFGFDLYSVITFSLSLCPFSASLYQQFVSSQIFSSTGNRAPPTPIRDQCLVTLEWVCVCARVCMPTLVCLATTQMVVSCWLRARTKTHTHRHAHARASSLKHTHTHKGRGSYYSHAAYCQWCHLSLWDEWMNDWISGPSLFLLPHFSPPSCLKIQIDFIELEHL